MHPSADPTLQNQGARLRSASRVAAIAHGKLPVSEAGDPSFVTTSDQRMLLNSKPLNTLKAPPRQARGSGSGPPVGVSRAHRSERPAAARGIALPASILRVRGLGG